MKRLSPTLLLPLAWVVLLVVWVFRLKGNFPAFMDTATYTFPEKWVNTIQWASGCVPLWNPWIACGTPHLAQSQPACFYPPFFLWVWTGLADWFFYISLAHTVWALAGFFLWARKRGASQRVAWLGAGSFAFSASFVIYWGFPTHLASVSWIPWIFLTLEHALEKKAAGSWAVFAMCLAMQTLAGYAYFCLYTYAALLAWMVFDHRTTRRHWEGVVAASAGAFLLAAVQILPFVDYTTYANRPLGEFFALKPVEWLALFWPDALGFPGLASYRGVTGHSIFNPSVGLLPLFGLLLALGSRRKEGRFFAWASVVVMLLMAGIPFVPMRLEPAKGAPVFVFLVVTAGMLFWDRWARIARFPKGWLWLGVLVWVVDICWMPFRMVPLVPDPFREPQAVKDAAQIRQYVGEGRLLTLRPLGEMYPTGRIGSPETSLEYHLRWAAPNTNAVWGIRSFGGYLSNTVDGFQNVRKYLERGVRNERLLDVASVRILVGPTPLPFKKYTVQQTLADVPLTRNAGAQPSAWRVSYVKEFPDRPSAIEATMDPSAFVEQEVFTEKSPAGGGVCLAAPERSLSGVTASSFGWWEKVVSGWTRLWGGGNTVMPARVSPCREEMTADFREQGWMVWSETYAPGWRAWVDGAPKNIFRAYGLFMAVPVKGTGLHRVSFRYEPTAFRIGLFLSLAAWAALFAAAVSFVFRWKAES